MDIKVHITNAERVQEGKWKIKDSKQQNRRHKTDLNKNSREETYNV